MTDRRPPDGEAGRLIRRLDLEPHPEGGWFRETWRAPAPGGARPASTAILFLLAAGERSHWHTVDADEIWLHQAGAPLALAYGAPGRITTIELWNGGAEGAAFQATVPATQWQAARSLGAWSLASCVVAPGFAFAGFTLAPPDWAPEGGEGFFRK